MVKLLKNIDLYTGYKHMPDAYIRFSDKILDVGYMADFVPDAEDTVIGGQWPFSGAWLY